MDQQPQQDSRARGRAELVRQAASVLRLRIDAGRYPGMSAAAAQRHPRYLGLREDNDPGDVVREEAR